MINHRAIFDVFFFASVLFAPLLLTVLLCIIGLLTWSRYYEAVIGAICVELLFRGAPSFLFGFPYPFALGMVVLIVLLRSARTVLRTTV